MWRHRAFHPLVNNEFGLHRSNEAVYKPVASYCHLAIHELCLVLLFTDSSIYLLINIFIYYAYGLFKYIVSGTSKRRRMKRRLMNNSLERA